MFSDTSSAFWTGSNGSSLLFWGNTIGPPEDGNYPANYLDEGVVGDNGTATALHCLEGSPTTRTVPPLARIFASNHHFDTQYLNNYGSY
jgi:hypothetical protein